MRQSVSFVTRGRVRKEVKDDAFRALFHHIPGATQVSARKSQSGGFDLGKVILRIAAFARGQTKDLTGLDNVVEKLVEQGVVHRW